MSGTLCKALKALFVDKRYINALIKFKLSTEVTNSIRKNRTHRAAAAATAAAATAAAATTTTA